MTQPGQATPRSVLITGASSGIGLCTAHGLKKRGYRVFASVRKKEDMTRLQALGFESVHLDLAHTDSVQSAVDEILERTGGQLYALFNNGAYGQPGAVEDLRREVLREQFEVNVFGTHELTCRVIPIMRAQGHGRIIQNSSVLGFVVLAYRGAYNATKFALEGLSDTLRLELKDTPIHVSIIEPGPITSQFRANAYQAYQRNIDPSQSAHRSIYEIVERRLKTEEEDVRFTLPPEAVLKKVIHALESPRPKHRYYVTFPTYLFAWLKRFLPDSALESVLARIK